MSEADEEEDPIAEQIHAIERLTQEVERLNTHPGLLLLASRWRMLGQSLLRGLAFGLGSVLGASILVSLLAWWLAQIEFLPIIGEWAAEIAREIEQSR